MASTDIRYLDLTGLTKYDEKIKDLISTEDAKKVDKDSNAKQLTGGFTKITTNADGLVTGSTAVTKADITGLGIVATDTKNTVGATKESLSASASIPFIWKSAAGSESAQSYVSDSFYIDTSTQRLKLNNNDVAFKSDITAAVTGATVFRGSLGTGGTITELPDASDDTLGDMYKVITAGTYQSIAAKVGDLFICGKPTGATSASWTLIPSGDEPAGTVTSISAGTSLKTSTGGAITDSGTISHADGAQSAFDAGVYKIGADSTGHVIKGAGISVASNGAHTHTVSGSVTVPSVSSSSKSVGVTVTKNVSFLTQVNLATNKMETTSIRGVSGTTDIIPAVAVASTSRPTRTVLGSNTSASKATAGTAVTYGNANYKSAATTVVTAVSSTPYNATYSADDECLTLTAVTVTSGSIHEATASTSKITPYTFTDVTVPVISSNSEIDVASAGVAVTVAQSASSGYDFTVATGAVSSTGTGATVVTGQSAPTAQTAVTGVTFGEVTTGGTSLVSGVTVGSKTASLTNGTAASAGGHSHTLS